MKKNVFLLLCLIFSFAISISFSEEIIPVGETVNIDDNGIPTYQVQNGEIKTGYKILGSGRPLLILMGLGGTIEDWPKVFIDMLSEEYQVILMDNRGMGSSTDTDKPFTYEMLSEDVISFMDVLGLEKTDIMGYSMGSIFTQYILLNYPERIDRAVLHATAYDSTKVMENLYEHSNEPLPEEGPVKKQMDISADWKVDPELFSSVDNDVLLIAGTDDNILDIENSVVLSNYIENSWLIKFRGTDHYLLFYYPVDFGNVIIDFLNHMR